MSARHSPRVIQNSTHTVNAVISASTVLRALQVAVPSCLSADVRGSSALAVVCTELCASLKALSVHVINVASVEVDSAGQRQRATTACVGAAIVLRAGKALWASLLGAGCGSFYSLAGSDGNADDALTG